MKDETFKGKFTSFCRKIGKRNMIIAASFIVVAVALIIGVSAFSRQDDGFDYSQGVGLDQTEQSTEQSGTDSTESAADSYFSSVQVNRQRTRDEALEVLQGVVDNTESTASAKEEALAEINKLAKVMEAESNIETLVVAKGFEECVAVISEDSVSVIVSADSLQAAEAAQILAIVYDTTGISPEKISIINK